MEREPDYPEGGERQDEPIYEQLSDEQRIARGLAQARDDERAIDDATARRIAAQLHGGQDSALYALASSGALPEGLEQELTDTAREVSQTQDPWIDALLDYAEARGEDRAPREEWAQLTRDQPEPQPETPEGRAAAEQRARDRARFERLIAAGIRPDDAEAMVEFEHHLRQQWASSIAQPGEAAEAALPPETAAPGTPRIYVASLSDYNAGTLHGRWIDAAQDADDVQAEVEAMLAASPEPDAEEVAIHDYEGFGPFYIGEHEPLEKVAALAQLAERHGPAFLAWAAHYGTGDIEELGRAFDRAYLGEYDSPEAYAEHVITESGAGDFLRYVPSDLEAYVRIDYPALARDWQFDHLVVIEAEDGSRVWVYDRRA